MYLSTTDSYASGAKTTIRLEAAGGLYVDRGNLYSPLYYDKDNSSYYTDPAGTSNVRHITMRAAGELKMHSLIMLLTLLMTLEMMVVMLLCVNLLIMVVVMVIIWKMVLWHIR